MAAGLGAGAAEQLRLFRPCPLRAPGLRRRARQRSALWAGASYSSAHSAGDSYSHAQAGSSPAEIMLEAMIYAARADVHIDEEEKQLIMRSASELCPGVDLQQTLQHLLSCPIAPEGLAARVSDPQQRRDLYLISSLIVNQDTFMERNYLSALTQALELSAELKASLDEQAALQRRQLLQS